MYLDSHNIAIMTTFFAFFIEFGNILKLLYFNFYNIRYFKLVLTYLSLVIQCSKNICKTSFFFHCLLLLANITYIVSRTLQNWDVVLCYCCTHNARIVIAIVDATILLKL